MNNSNLKDLSKEFKNNILKKIKKNGLALQYISNELKNNKEIVLTAVKQDGLALQYASNELKKNKEVVLTAVNQNGMALQYTTNFDEKIIIDALNQNIKVLNYLNKWVINYKNIINNFSFEKNKEIILKIIKYNHIYYQYLSDVIRKDINITKKNSKN